MSNSGSRQRVLVVDDDEVMREMLSLVLDCAGYQVRTAETGEAALMALLSASAAEMPHCVLCDLQMPGLCGAELGARLADVCPAKTLRVAMSGSKLKSDEAATFDAFLLKPFAVEDFETVLQQARREPVDRPETEAEEPAVLNESIYAKLQASMPAVQLGQLYALCLEDALARVERMRTAADAGDAGLYMREAHAVKGGCGMLGAAELQALAGKMEAGALTSTPLLQEFSSAADRLRRMLEARP